MEATNHIKEIEILNNKFRKELDRLYEKGLISHAAFIDLAHHSTRVSVHIIEHGRLPQPE